MEIPQEIKVKALEWFFLWGASDQTRVSAYRPGHQEFTAVPGVGVIISETDVDIYPINDEWGGGYNPHMDELFICRITKTTYGDFEIVKEIE